MSGTGASPEAEAVDVAEFVRDILGAPRATRTATTPSEGSPRVVDESLPLSVEVAGWDDERILTGVVTLETLVRQVDAWRVALAGEVAERSGRGRADGGMAATRGCRTARELLRRLTGSADATIGRRLRLAASVRTQTSLTGSPLPPRFAQVASAVDAGTIALDAAHRIIEALEPTRATAGDAALAAGEEELVGACAASGTSVVPPIDADQVKVQAATWAQFLDQDGARPAEVDAERRFLRLSAGTRGLVRLQGMLLPQVAAMMQAFADACTNPRTAEVPDPTRVQDRTAANQTAPGQAAPDHTAPVATAANQTAPEAGVGQSDTAPNDDPALDTSARASDAPEDGDAELAAAADQRSNAQRMHDVFATALQAAARVADQRSIAGNSPTLVVAVRERDLATGTGSATTLGSTPAGGHLPLPVSAAQQIACAGAVQKVVLDDGGRITGLRSPERCFTGTQRRAIALRDGGCVIPGCGIPAAWCEVHHVVEYARDPDGTHTDNGVLLCWHHHRTIDRSGWRIRMIGGVPHVRAPEWLIRLGRAGPDDDGWRRAAGSPIRFLEALGRDRRLDPSGDVQWQPAA